MTRRCRRHRRRLLAVITLVATAGLGACSTRPLQPWSADTPPLVLVPATQAGVQDQRGRFREVFCAVLEARKDEIPDYRECDEALTRLESEPEGTGKPVNLGVAARPLVAVLVPGVGWDCFAEWLQVSATTHQHLRRFGYDIVTLEVDSLASSERNARLIRDAIMDIPRNEGPPQLVLVGYSKGAPDILQALVSYPEIRPRVAAVVSVSGSIGGSALANDATQSRLELLRHWPGARCQSAGSDPGALEDLRPASRMRWLAANPLPEDVPLYSLGTFPRPDNVSALLRPTWNKLGRVDARNDGQVIFHGQVIPGSTLAGYLNADHWAAAVPIARAHPTIGSLFVTRNEFPREALMEALLRFVEEDLASAGR